MSNVNDLESFSIADINAMIQNRTEENIHLDFKESGAIDMSDPKKNEIAKDVSAFANSDGGVIIYGIKEIDHTAGEKSYIDGNTYTKEWLEQVISSRIQRPINDIIIFPIHEDGDISKSIFVVKIPRSNNSPHMAPDHRYYRRQNFKNAVLEDYEVRDLFSRKNKSKLRIEGCSFYYTDNSTLSFFATIANISNVVEPIYKLNVYLSGTLMEQFADMTLSWAPIEEKLFRTIKYKKIKLTAVGENPVFPDEGIDLCRFTICSKSGFSECLMKNTKVELLLYNEAGEQDEYETTMYDALISPSILQD